MATADWAGAVGALVIAAGAGGGFFYWQGEQRRAEEARWEASVDTMVDSKLDTLGLAFVRPALDAHPDARLETLRGLYADPAQSDQINVGFGTLRGDWNASYGHLANQAGRDAESRRLQAEVAERFGAGAYELMEANYTAFLADAPRRLAEQEAQRQAEMRAVEEYFRRHGRFPAGAFHFENGRLVED